MEIFLYALVSCSLAALGALSVASFGAFAGFIDHPNERSSHHVSTPKGGGIGILMAFVSVALLAGVSVMFWLPASIIAAVSLYGDKRHLSPFLRLCVQFGGTFVLLVGNKYGFPSSLPAFLLFLLSAIYIVGTANVYNFMDGINGIAALTAIVGFGLLSLFMHSSGAHSPCMTLAASLAFACIGFLPFNVPRAKVFMGDVGSILLGFAFASFVVKLAISTKDVACLASFLFPFYADECTTMFLRVRAGENIMQAHRKHLYQILANELDIAHWKVSTSYGIFQLLVGIHLFTIRKCSLFPILGTLSGYFLLFSICSYFVRKRVAGNKEVPPK